MYGNVTVEYPDDLQVLQPVRLAATVPKRKKWRFQAVTFNAHTLHPAEGEEAYEEDVRRVNLIDPESVNV